MRRSTERTPLENDRRDLRGAAAVDRIEETAMTSHTCFFCTRNGAGPASGVRPMSVREVDAAGNLWFLSAVDSRKNREIERDAEVQLFFQGAEHSDFLHLSGRAEVLRDRRVIEALWTPLAKAWFEGGVNDPRITAIKVTPSDGQYWDTKYGRAVAGAAMLIGAAIGEPLGAAVQGSVRP